MGLVKSAADKPLTRRRVKTFQQKIHRYYERHGRDLPWRKNISAYRVLVAEIMLQQTQVERVIEKYPEFLSVFPNFRSLASASLRRVLSTWSGLGYNRRALALRALAQQVIEQHRGRLPRDEQKLLLLPGIGRYTAGAVTAFAFNQPAVFMDTNIRRVYIHEFLPGHNDIHDEQLLPLVRQTLDTDNPATWYNALMDYGSMLKRDQVNPNRRSVHYTRQSAFENSKRQLRGRILRVLLRSPLTMTAIVRETGKDPGEVKACLSELEREGFVTKNGAHYRV